MISSAFAQTAAPAAADGGMFGLLPIVIMFALLYFMMIRPQTKKAKEQKLLVDALKKGDEVIAVGMIGKIVKVTDTYIGLEVASGTVIHLQKHTVTTLLPTGTYQDVAGK
ncbi:MAG: preprotein translocase subunit YajC [Betaproteobacteria bacterium]|nr:preprotein translocase subunit YajC [Betaproteobacteria bacterium]